ncbi:glutamate-1-semialdehyde 2,1-aminomutase [Longimicrobium sp.]|uniref:glutamate-1-semialdehyde 2,1-aminomutase n=1 Tax=Longimicrobium sp. TaxID=2029185 RepID=UPI002E322F8A|nr:glutamate-1-semialdehyde 2,1-aminomutase [Longimicrobium sp.]HEX6041521.1 glutamate-1-semialdehyde 2,1-aminomutase [Longimicrobium sp.]
MTDTDHAGQGKTSASRDLFRRACGIIPGGVNSPVRAFRAVGGEPFFVQRAAGSRLWDADGNEYIDYVLSWGPMILGHAHPAVVHAVADAATRGTSYGAPTAAEVELAEAVQGFFPSMQRLRFVNSGTEATMSAVRLARGFTGRELILKFEGCYHGHGDSFLVKAGSGVATLGLPNSPGVPAELSKLTLTAPFNDLEAVETIFRAHPGKIACVILEPVVGNAGFIPPDDGFLQALRRITEADGALLVFDEVMTGFRVAPGGAQERFGIVPDLTTLGKVIGGGLPVGAYGGRADVMDWIAPVGPVYQAGTLSGNPLAMAAGLAQLRILRDENPYPELERRTARLVDGLLEIGRERGVPMTGGSLGSMWGVFLAAGPVRSFEDAKASDVETFRRFYHALLRRGVFFAPSAFEAGFMSTAHTDQDVEATLSRAREALAEARP